MSQHNDADPADHSLLTEEDKRRIIQFVTFEQHVREAVNAAGRKKGWASWLNSSVGLLIIGALLTGILVPIFQSTQTALTWQRQNHYAVLNAQLDTYRKFLGDFAQLQVFAAQTYDLYRLLGDIRDFGEDEHQEMMEKWRELQNRRYEHTARVSASITQFGGERSLEEPYQHYINLLTQYLNLLYSMGSKRRQEPTENQPLASTSDLGATRGVENKTNIQLTDGDNIEQIHIAMANNYNKVITAVRREIDAKEKQLQSFYL